MKTGNLIVERQKGEGVVLDGGIRVAVHRIMGRRVWLSVQAPRDVAIKRDELCQQGESGKENAA